MDTSKPEKMTIANCMLEMTSKESTVNAIRQLIEFHVKAALQAAANNAEIEDCGNPYDPDDDSKCINRESILNAYPENLIQ